MMTLAAGARSAKTDDAPHPSTSYSDQCMRRESLLQEGVSCALATLGAIESADLFRVPPQNETEAKLHNDGCWLLGMLYDQLTRLQQKVDELSGAVAPKAED